LVSRTVAVLGALILLVVLYSLFFPPRPPEAEELPAGAVEESTRPFQCGELEGQDYNHECRGSVLVWRRCARGTESTRTLDCATRAPAGFEGFCNPSASDPLRPGFALAACDSRPRAATPGPTAEPLVATATPTPQPTVREGVGYCGDGACAPDESCNTCIADCGCSAGLTCEAATGVCVRT
jgi:hypothetical protein